MAAREESAHRLARLVKKARRQVRNTLRDHLTPVGMSLPVVQIIKRVVSGGHLSQLELAQDLELEPAAVSRLVAELESQGFVVRRRDPADQRRLLMTATAKGRALLARAQPLVRTALTSLVSRLTAGEQKQLCQLLEKLCDDSDATTNHARPEPRGVPAGRSDGAKDPAPRNIEPRQAGARTSRHGSARA